MRRDFLLFLLSDSALPTGGFVASSGLEAAWTLRCLERGADGANQSKSAAARVATFLAENIASYAQQHVPLVVAIYHAQVLQDVQEIDDWLDANTTNDVTRRASVAQGISYLTLATKAFSDHVTDRLTYDWIQHCRSQIRQKTMAGHLTTAYALLARSLGLPLEDALHLYLSLYARAMLSAAVRMNLVDPYRAQSMLCDVETLIETQVERHKSRSWQLAMPTNPFLDLIAGAHEALYTRMFNS